MHRAQKTACLWDAGICLLRALSRRTSRAGRRKGVLESDLRQICLPEGFESPFEAYALYFRRSGKVTVVLGSFDSFFADQTGRSTAGTSTRHARDVLFGRHVSIS